MSSEELHIQLQRCPSVYIYLHKYVHLINLNSVNNKYGQAWWLKLSTVKRKQADSWSAWSIYREFQAIHGNTLRTCIKRCWSGGGEIHNLTHCQMFINFMIQRQGGTNINILRLIMESCIAIDSSKVSQVILMCKQS